MTTRRRAAASFADVVAGRGTGPRHGGADAFRTEAQNRILPAVGDKKDRRRQSGARQVAQADRKQNGARRCMCCSLPEMALRLQSTGRYSKMKMPFQHVPV
jgi:hypothetical protein